MHTHWLRSASLAVFCALAAGCLSHEHTVGLGAAGSEVQVARQYYWLFGLIEVNDVDAARMAGGLTSYSIETEYGAVDFVLAPFLAVLLSTSRTVIVRT